MLKEKTNRKKICRRCGKFYNTTHKFSKVCEECKKERGQGISSRMFKK